MILGESSNANESTVIKLPVKKPLLQYSRTKDSEIEIERKIMQIASLEGFGVNHFNHAKLALLQGHVPENPRFLRHDTFQQQQVVLSDQDQQGINIAQNSPTILNSPSHPLINSQKQDEVILFQGIEEIKDEIGISEKDSVSSHVNINPPFGSMGHLEDPQFFKNNIKPDNKGRVQESTELKNKKTLDNISGIDFARPAQIQDEDAMDKTSEINSIFNRSSSILKVLIGILIVMHTFDLLESSKSNSIGFNFILALSKLIISGILFYAIYYHYPSKPVLPSKVQHFSSQSVQTYFNTASKNSLFPSIQITAQHQQTPSNQSIHQAENNSFLKDDLNIFTLQQIGNQSNTTNQGGQQQDQPPLPKMNARGLISKPRPTMPITQNEKESLMNDEAKSKSDVRDACLIERGFEDKQRSTLPPQRKQGMVIPPLEIEVIDEGSNPSRQYKDSESVELQHDLASSKKPELRRINALKRVESKISSFVSSENDDQSRQDNITQFSAAVPIEIAKSAFIDSRINKKTKNAAESSNHLTIHRNNRWMLDLKHGKKMANISCSNNDIPHQHVSGNLTSNQSNTNLSIKKTKKRINDKLMAEELNYKNGQRLVPLQKTYKKSFQKFKLSDPASPYLNVVKLPQQILQTQCIQKNNQQNGAQQHNALQCVSERNLSDFGRSENCVSHEIRPIFHKQTSKDMSSSQPKYLNRLRKLQTIDSSTIKDSGAANLTGVSFQELFKQQQFNYLKMLTASQQKNKVLEEKISQLQENHCKNIEQLEIKLKNTKIFLNMVIHDMRNPTTSIEFAVKEVIRMLERQIRISKTNGLNGMIGSMTQMMSILQPQITNPFLNTSGQSNCMQIQSKGRVVQSIIQNNEEKSDTPKQLFSQGFKGNNMNMESNHQFDHNRYDEHQQSSSSEEEKKMHESAVMDLDPNVDNDCQSAGEKSRKSSANNNIDELDFKDLQQKSCGIESIVSNDLQSNADHASSIPLLRALQKTFSPLLFDIKAPVQGRQMIPISSSNTGQPSINIIPSHRRSNILADTSPKTLSGRVGSHNSELKSALSKNRRRQQEEIQKRHVKIVQITDGKTVQANSDINLHPEKKKTPIFKVSDQRIAKSDMDLLNQQNSNKQKQPKQKVSIIITKTLLQEGGDISEVDDQKAEKPSSRSSSSCAISEEEENEEEKKEQIYYQTFGKPNSQGGSDREEENEGQKEEPSKQNTQQLQIFAQNTIGVALPLKNQGINQQQEIGQLYAEALRQRLSLLQSQSGEAPNINLQNKIKSFRQLTSVQNQYEEIDNLLKTANFSASMLLNLINDLLDLAKMENQSFNLNASYFNLEQEVIQQSVLTLAHMIKEKKININIAFSKGQNLNEGSEHYLRCIYTDKARFLQIMLNFMSNAIKFTPEGGNVSIETVVKETQDIRKREKSGDQTGDNSNNKGSDLDNKNIKKIKNEFEMMTAKRCLTPRVRQDDNKKGMIKPQIDQETGKQKYINFEIRIKDSGVGIAKENLSKLFLNFSRLEDHQKSNERGTGLGLSICKSLLEKMGGTVTVESEGLGFGTTFIIQMQAKCKVVSSKQSQRHKTSAMNLSNNFDRHRMMKSQLKIRTSTSQAPPQNSKQKKLHEFGRIESGLVYTNSITLRKKNFNKNLPSINIDGEGSLSRVNNKSDYNEEDGEKQFQKKCKHRTGIFSSIVNDGQNDYLNIKSQNINQINQFGIPIMSSSSQKKSMLPVNPFKSNLPFDSASPLQHSKANQSIINQLDLSIRYDNQSIGDFDIQDNDQPRYRVLLANDDTFQLLMINRVLGLFDEFHQRIEQVENGMVAVNKVLESRKAAKEGDVAEYDVILLDLDMPILDGYGACRQIKEAENGGNQGIHALLQLDNSCLNEPNQQTRANSLQKSNHASIIIALTALLNQDIIEKCKQAGFDDWIESPLTKDKIQEKIIDKLAFMRGQKDPKPVSPSLQDQSEDNEYDEEYDEEEYGEEVVVDESELNEDSVVMEDEEGADESEKDNGPVVPHQGKREPYMQRLRESFHLPDNECNNSHNHVKD